MSIIMTMSLTAIAGILAAAGMCRLVLEIMPKHDA
jgi:hypothetical protein